MVTFGNPLDLGAGHFGLAAAANFLPHNLVHRSTNAGKFAIAVDPDSATQAGLKARE